MDWQRSPTRDVERQELLATLAESWSPGQIRNLAGTLLRLADSLGQEWTGPKADSVFRWPGPMSNIERNAMNLAWEAKFIYSRREERRHHLPARLLGEPAWDMLLELFAQYAGGAKVSVTSLCLASNVPVTTALRYIDELEGSGMIEKEPSKSDRRVTYIGLSRDGILAMGTLLMKR